MGNLCTPGELPFQSLTVAHVTLLKDDSARKGELQATKAEASMQVLPDCDVTSSTLNPKP